MSNKQEHADFWLRLDNAAKIYPAVTTREQTSVFRLSVDFIHPVRVKPLLEAVRSLGKRFPYFKVVKKTGFFWPYLDLKNQPLKIMPDQGLPCRAFGKDEQLIRILVKGNTLSVEYSHMITDGGGGLAFLKTLVLQYLKACGKKVPEEAGGMDVKSQPSNEEYEDAFNRFFKKIRARQIKTPPAFHLPFPLNAKPRLRMVVSELPTKEILGKAKSYGVSITNFLVAAYLNALQEVYLRQSPLQKRFSGKVIRIQVPVNLRNIYPTKTLRNFSLYVIPGIDMRLGTYSFEEILKIVYHQMQLETDEKLISKVMSRNVGGERMWLVRIMPFFLKSFMLNILYARGTRQYSSVVTNLGRIDLGSEVNRHIRRFLFLPPPPNPKTKISCAVAGFEDSLVLSIGNVSRFAQVERLFFGFLIQQGIPVKILKHSTYG